MGTAKYDQRDFNARIKRIRNPRNDSYYDPELRMHIPKHISREKIRKASKAEEPSYLSAVLVSMIIGAMALAIGQWVRVQYFGLLEANVTTLTLDLTAALWALLVLSVLLGHRGFMARMAQAAGIYLMLIAGHNLVWRWPEQMAWLYSPAYVDQVMATTVSQSVVINGALFAL
ncbi:MULTISPECIES: hypothetical protein [unclassified Yoonia]|uniref:hypothetical protein n=1 Tax=unclassified Yoonia TaxID=2629118 RepID=UPI002AFEC2AA|nr:MULTISPECIES: hypothetical protein [unclassified Yoonia]